MIEFQCQAYPSTTGAPRGTNYPRVKTQEVVRTAANDRENAEGIEVNGNTSEGTAEGPGCNDNKKSYTTQ